MRDDTCVSRNCIAWSEERSLRFRRTQQCSQIGPLIRKGWHPSTQTCDLSHAGPIISIHSKFDQSPGDLIANRSSHIVKSSPLRFLWNEKNPPLKILISRTWSSILEDRLFGRAAELGFYFLFALFPTLFSASSILGLAARSAGHIYDRLLSYLALVIPTAALGTVLQTFNETTAAATSGKVTFGLIAAIWSASAGVSAIQDALNSVYKVQDSRSYLRAHVYAIGLTILLTIIFTLVLAAMLGGDFFAALAGSSVRNRFLLAIVAVLSRCIGWAVATALLSLFFAVIYHWAPDLKARRWQWFSPGGTFGMAGWLVASLGLRIYLHFFNSYSVTYGSLGAVIILLTWFYITGLMLLVGAEINSLMETAPNTATTDEP